MNCQKTILFLSANPKSTTSLRFSEEVRDIADGLRKAQKRDMFKIETRFAVRPRDIGEAMLQTKPHFVHFSGHGGGQKGLVLEDNNGEFKLVSTEALSDLFRLFSDTVECVLLNACYSEIQAEAISQNIDYVVGMSEAIDDTAAIEFAVGFYTALGADRTIEFAYEFACNAIGIARGIGSHIPIIITKHNSANSNNNFAELKRLLEAKDWKKADLETRSLILKSVGLRFDEEITPAVINNIPASILLDIDKLWTKYSNGHFGFSTQIEIYISLGRDTVEWSKKVGWRRLSQGVISDVNGITEEFFFRRIKRAIFGWIPYDSLDFTLNAHKGHLPALGKNGYGSNGRLWLLSALEHKLASSRS